MPDVEFAFLADAAETPPGQKFSVLGGGVTRIGGPAFPLRHPHIALVICLAVKSVGSTRSGSSCSIPTATRSAAPRAPSSPRAPAMAGTRW